MRADQFVTGYVGQAVKVENKFTDYELAVMEGGLSLDKPKSALHQAVTEAFDQPYKILRWEKGDFGDVDAIARLDDNTFLSIMFNKGYSKGTKEEAWSVEFYRNNSQEVTGEGDAQRVFATVISAIQTFIEKYKPNKITFSASKEVEDGQNTQSRARLYDSLVQRYARSWGFRAFRADTGNKVIYELSRIKPVAEGLDEDAVRAEAQAAYMQGRCMILAVAINQLNPKRYTIGYIWEYNAAAGAPDMQLDDDEWENLNPQEQEEISKDISRHSIVHAYVRDRDTNEYIDARGRHRDIPNLWGRLGVTRFEEFPGTARELIDITVNGEWDEVGEQVNFKRGQSAFDSMAGPAGVKQAQDYAVKYLNIDLSKGSQSTPKKSVWMNPGDPLPPSSSTGTWVILGPYKNVLYRFSASTEQRASAMKDQWCKENNIDPDSNRFCRLKYDGDVRLGQPIKKQGVAEARNSLFAFVKQQFPTWPDYVLKDFLYAQAKGIRDQAELDDFLKRNKQDFGNCKWTLTKLPITFDIFTPKTQRMLASREGGSSNPFQVPRDAERHALQSQMIQQKGVSVEPIIVAKLSNGYDLIEGWHRTIQHLKAFPQGYTGPAWVCTGATYKSENVNQGVAENFADGRVKGKSRPGRVKRSGASCDGSVSDLRSKAKNASGERAKMYHWCANMKNGRAKTESEMLEDLNAIWKNVLEAGVYKGYPCTKDCSGHAAGDRWADARNITDPNECPYSNNSFWEGCLAHTDEQE